MKKSKVSTNAVCFESEIPIDVLSKADDKGRLWLKMADKKYDGNPCEKSLVAQFKVPIETDLLGFKLEANVKLQFNSGSYRSVFARATYADFYYVYQLLKENFNTGFRAKKFDLSSEIYDLSRKWRWNEDYLVMALKHNPGKTTALLNKYYRQFITIMSINKLPREFGEEKSLIILDYPEDEFEL